jgi:predicted amidohydrolase
MPDPTPVMIAGVQMDVTFGDVAANRAAILDGLARAADLGAKLVVFPECALTGYCFASRDEAMPHAETIPGPTTEAVALACRERGVFAAFGLIERDGDRLYNACALVGPAGMIGSYRKVHLPSLGLDRLVDPGDRPFAVHEVGGVRVGMQICYDGGFPEATRVQALLGADLIVLPTNWPTHAECAAEHQMATRAMENVVYAVAVNRVGEERGFRFIGRSSIHGIGGERLAFAGPDGEEILIAEIDPARARRKRQVRVPGKHEIDRFADRRPEFYEPIVAPNRRVQDSEAEPA